jgi:hypothetical protein
MSAITQAGLRFRGNRDQEVPCGALPMPPGAGEAKTQATLAEKGETVPFWTFIAHGRHVTIFRNG